MDTEKNQPRSQSFVIDVTSCTDPSAEFTKGGLSVVLTLGGTNDGDAVYIYSIWLEYTKLLLNG